MYETFFNLKRKPFELVPNPEFIYLSRTHKRAVTFLEYGIRERVGFVLLTGDVGSGKTTIVRDMIKKATANVTIANITNTKANSEQLLSMITSEFDLNVQIKDKVTLIKELNDYLIDRYARGKHSILLIDEAQNLNQDMLEEVRLLSNLETDDTKLLQIILVGQPEIRTMLSRPDMRQLRQRIGVGCHITPLSISEVAEYIRHRLEVAGNREAILFPDSVVTLIHGFSRGIPRLINILCDYLMLSAFIDERRELTDKITTEIIEELDLENQYWDRSESCHHHEPMQADIESVHSITPDTDLRNRETEDSTERIRLMMKLEEFEERNRKMTEMMMEKLETISAEVMKLKSRNGGNGSPSKASPERGSCPLPPPDTASTGMAESHRDVMAIINMSSDNFLSILKNEEIITLLDTADQLILEDGQILDCDVDFGRYVYIVRDGAMKILSPADPTSIRIGILHRGGVYGIDNLLNRKTIRTQAMALKKTTLYKLSTDLLREVLSKHPEYLRSMNSLISRLDENPRGEDQHAGSKH